MLRRVFISLGLVLTLYLGGEPLTIQQKPVAAIQTPDSILKKPPKTQVRHAGSRKRYSTCTGVNWIHGSDNLYAISMHTSTIQYYRFDPVKNQLKLVHNHKNSQRLGLKRPENLAISPNEKWMAIPNMPSGKVQIYAIDKDNGLCQTPLKTIQGHLVHGVRFTPNGKYIGWVELNPGSKICFAKIFQNAKGKTVIKNTQVFKNPFKGLVPKSLDFSKDERFVVIGWCVQLKKKQGSENGLVASYRFDSKRGIMETKPVSLVKGLSSVETLVFPPKTNCFFTTDQIHDRIIGFPFNQETGAIGAPWTALQNPDAELSFPHGISFSDKHVAISNYGDDRVTVYDYSQAPD